MGKDGAPVALTNGAGWVDDCDHVFTFAQPVNTKLTATGQRLKVDDSAAARENGGVNIFVLAGQSNMEGKGKGSDCSPNCDANNSACKATYHQGLGPGALLSGTSLNGTSLYQIQDSRTAKDFAQYWNDETGNWTVLDDVIPWVNGAATESLDSTFEFPFLFRRIVAQNGARRRLPHPARSAFGGTLMMNFVFKMMNFVFKMMNFVLSPDPR